jgi:ElaB/YqjD/DUF883 family membrane-anchored ribosome-binding protein
MNDDATASREQLLEDMRTVIADAEALLQATAGEARAEVDQTRSRVLGSIESAKARLSALDDSVREHAKEATKAADDFVKDNPWRAVGIAAVVGVIAGVMIARR